MKLQFLSLGIFSFFLFASSNGVQAQCPFDPTIEGDTILCPEGSTELKTQVYDAYQWYRRAWGASQAEPIPGATGQSIVLTEVDALNYYSVEATLNGCTETSPEVLLDAWAFLLPTLSLTGNYEFDPNTQSFLICEGDTMFLTLNPPYEASITWYNNGVPIPGETGITLPVTQSGAYTVVGAPAICPNFILSPGVVTEVTVDVCNATGEPQPGLPELALFPNPVADVLRIHFSSPSPAATWRLTNVAGQQLASDSFTEGKEAEIDLSQLPAGVYLLHLRFAEGKTVVRKIVKD
jgi:hypothetical protein